MIDYDDLLVDAWKEGFNSALTSVHSDLHPSLVEAFLESQTARLTGEVPGVYRTDDGAWLFVIHTLAVQKPTVVGIDADHYVVAYPLGPPDEYHETLAQMVERVAVLRFKQLAGDLDLPSGNTDLN